MSRGDEIQADEPLKPRRDREDAAAGWGDDDDRQVAHPQRSLMVTAVGVVAIVFGCFVLLGSITAALFPVIMPACIDFAAQMNPNDPNLVKAKDDLAKIPSWYMMGTAAVDFVRAIGLIIGGIGVVRRARFGRGLILIMALLGVIMFLVGLGATFLLGTMDMGDPSSVAGGAFGIVCSGTLNVGFAVMALTGLLPAKNAAEFRS
jgi:hypothetical protein